MFFFDPIYLLFIAPGLLLSLWASYRTKSAFNKYSQVPSMRGLTGAPGGWRNAAFGRRGWNPDCRGAGLPL